MNTTLFTLNNIYLWYMILLSVIYYLWVLVLDIQKNSLIKYRKQKKEMEMISASLESDIKIDKNDKIIDVVNIENISKDLIYFLNKLREMERWFFILQDNKFKNKEKEYLLNLSIKYKNILNNWINYHKTELLEISNNLKNKSKINYNLDFHKKLIDIQIERISQIK